MSTLNVTFVQAELISHPPFHIYLDRRLKSPAREPGIDAEERRLKSVWSTKRRHKFPETPFLAG
jgi:hypothetical protein